jgi:hypothetical protein
LPRVGVLLSNRRVDVNRKGSCIAAVSGLSGGMLPIEEAELRPSSAQVVLTVKHPRMDKKSDVSPDFRSRLYYPVIVQRVGEV